MKENFRPQPENPKQTPHEGGSKSPEHQSLPSIWEVLERKVRLRAPDIEDRPRLGSQEYRSEADVINRLDRDLREKGTARDSLILDLYGEIRCEPAPFPNPVDLRNLTLEEFQQFRSRVELLDEDKLKEEIRKAQEEFGRRRDEFFKNEGGGFPPPESSVIV